MNREKALKLSAVFLVAGIFLILMPLTELVAYNQQGFLFAGLVSLLAAFMFRQLSESGGKDDDAKKP
ncbi:MAG: hypothetical protein GF409_06745 [Candidatus Omnitrophica bacterium]|nr:hypothetical protein [Candidatus Omnitrophota bacterium]